ncbi:MAG: hypothetical protein JW954_08060 [Dehalococcoidaceae bacterium]|nr:hypothetical protein [Dehalococcoidaceae bacterium]
MTELNLLTVDPETGKRTIPEETARALSRAFATEQEVSKLSGNAQAVMAQDHYLTSTQAAIEKLSDKLEASMEQMHHPAENNQSNQGIEDKLELNMKQNHLLGGLARLEIFGVPVGSALGGGTVALLTSEILEAALPDNSSNITRGLLKLLAGGAMVQFMSGLVGKGLSRTAATFLAFDATRDLIPLDQWIRNLINTVAPAQASQPKPYMPPAPSKQAVPAGPNLMDAQLERLLSSIH